MFNHIQDTAYDVFNSIMKVDNAHPDDLAFCFMELLEGLKGGEIQAVEAGYNRIAKEYRTTHKEILLRASKTINQTLADYKNSVQKNAKQKPSKRQKLCDPVAKKIRRSLEIIDGGYETINSIRSIFYADILENNEDPHYFATQVLKAIEFDGTDATNTIHAALELLSLAYAGYITDDEIIDTTKDVSKKAQNAISFQDNITCLGTYIDNKFLIEGYVDEYLELHITASIESYLAFDRKHNFMTFSNSLMLYEMLLKKERQYDVDLNIIEQYVGYFSKPEYIPDALQSRMFSIVQRLEYMDIFYENNILNPCLGIYTQQTGRPFLA